MAISFETALPSVEQFDDRIATLVYAELLERLGAKGYWNAFAGIALPTTRVWRCTNGPVRNDRRVPPPEIPDAHRVFTPVID